MILDFSKIICMRKEEPVRVNGEDLSLREAVIISLNHPSSDPKATFESKHLRGSLVRRLDKEESDFKVNEIAEMKKAVEQCPHWVPVVMVNIQDELDV